MSGGTGRERRHRGPLHLRPGLAVVKDSYAEAELLPLRSKSAPVACQERDLNDDGDFGDSNEVVYYHSTTLHSVYALTKKRVSPINRVQWEGRPAEWHHESPCD